MRILCTGNEISPRLTTKILLSQYNRIIIIIGTANFMGKRATYTDCVYTRYKPQRLAEHKLIFHRFQKNALKIIF